MTPVAAAIARWLLKSKIVIREGPHRGAVAGWLDGGSPSFAYPEVTGYYLSWLASLSQTEVCPIKFERQATDAMTWFSHIATGELPLFDPIPLNPKQEDCETAPSFTFDSRCGARGIVESVASLGRHCKRPIDTSLIYFRRMQRANRFRLPKLDKLPFDGPHSQALSAEARAALTIQRGPTTSTAARHGYVRSMAVVSRTLPAPKICILRLFP